MSFRGHNKGVRYIGSKGKCGEIARVINDLLPPKGVYCEPFCGACKIAQHVNSTYRYCSDADPHVIDLLKAIQEGWEPPKVVTESQYGRYKKWMKKGWRDPLVGFAGYACSFGGRFFEGYARSKKSDVNFAESARRSLLRQKPFLEGVYFLECDYRESLQEPFLYYLDPPYAGTKPCGSVKTKFDSAAFWEWAERRSRRSVVLVSEYACPLPQAVVVWEKEVAAGIRFGTSGQGGNKGSGKRKSEKLFLLNPERAGRLGMVGTL